ncbi:MAG TPA: hypothetical protein DDY20_10115 [Desulfobulbaceae bacterium]|nr:hypothetical protein [Desulfobulbaceae bacterium]
MPEQERRREDREPCPREIGVFLTLGRNGAAASPVIEGVLTSISRHGAGIALAEIMAGRTHLAYGPMGSDALQLNIVFPSKDEDIHLTLPVRPIWLKKEQGEGLPPFRLGVAFLEPLPPAILQRLNRQQG